MRETSKFIDNKVEEFIKSYWLSSEGIPSSGTIKWYDFKDGVGSLSGYVLNDEGIRNREILKGNIMKWNESEIRKLLEKEKEEEDRLLTPEEQLEFSVFLKKMADHPMWDKQKEKDRKSVV